MDTHSFFVFKTNGTELLLSATRRIVITKIEKIRRYSLKGEKNNKKFRGIFNLLDCWHINRALKSS